MIFMRTDIQQVKNPACVYDDIAVSMTTSVCDKAEAGASTDTHGILLWSLDTEQLGKSLSDTHRRTLD